MYGTNDSERENVYERKVDLISTSMTSRRNRIVVCSAENTELSLSFPAQDSGTKRLMEERFERKTQFVTYCSLTTL